MNILSTDGKILVPDNCPQLKIGDKLFTVDNRRSTWKKVQAMQKDDGDQDEEILRLALGKEAAKELIEKDLPLPEFQSLMLFILAAFTGESFEAVEAQARAKN